MKNFIITSGALLLILTIISFQMDCNQMLRQKEHLQFIADDVAAAVALSKGNHGFNEDKAMKIAQEMVKLNMGNEEVKVEVFLPPKGEEKQVVIVELAVKRLKTKGSYKLAL